MLWLWFRLQSYIDGLQVDNLYGLTLDWLSEAADRQRGMKQAPLKDGKLTRERIAQVKTCLADDESDDQRTSGEARREGLGS